MRILIVFLLILLYACSFLSEEQYSESESTMDIVATPNNDTTKIQEFHENGSLKRLNVFVKGERILERNYYKSGEVKSAGFIKNKKLHGSFKTYFRSGQISSEGYFKQHKQDSIFKIYNKKGVLIGQSSYKNGLLNGKTTGWWDSGQFGYSIPYKTGKKHGQSIVIDETGDTITIEIHDNGILIQKIK